MFINQVTLVGNITRDPELKSLPSGIKVCSFSLATNEVFKDKSGAKQEKVEFHNIVIFGTTAENVAKWMKKGSSIAVMGKIQTRSWDDKTTGEKKYRVEILANHISFGSTPKGSEPAEGGAPAVEGRGADLDTIDYGDTANVDDIPF